MNLSYNAAGSVAPITAFITDYLLQNNNSCLYVVYVFHDRMMLWIEQYLVCNPADSISASHTLFWKYASTYLFYRSIKYNMNLVIIKWYIMGRYIIVLFVHSSYCQLFKDWNYINVVNVIVSVHQVFWITNIAVVFDKVILPLTWSLHTTPKLMLITKYVDGSVKQPCKIPGKGLLQSHLFWLLQTSN